MARSDGKHAIRMPGQVLDQIRANEESGSYGKDPRFARKRSSEKPVPRKEKRKEERRLKKQRNNRNSKANHSEQLTNTNKETRRLTHAQPSSGDDEPGSSTDVPIGQLRALKARESRKKLPSLFDGKPGSSNSKTPKAFESEALYNEGSDTYEGSGVEGSGFEGSGFEGFESQASESEDTGSFDESNESDFDMASDLDTLEEEEDPIAKLRALKESKKTARNQKLSPKEKVQTKREISAVFDDPIDNDMEYYAKKLGLTNGKKSKLTKEDDDDVVGGILDGLDLDFSRSDDSEDFRDVEENISSEDDSDEELYANEKENPFIAPVQPDAETSDNDNEVEKYIPPALRRKMAESEGTSAEIRSLQRALKGPINKLSETNIGSIVNEINGLYLTNPRQAVNENLTSIIIDSILNQIRLLDTFVYLYAALVEAVYRTQGVDFGANFIQLLIEKLDSFRQDASKSKEALNLIALLSSVYNFQLVSSKLLYDIIRDLLANISEFNAELLLKIIRTSGNQMRSDDPSALKEIVLQVQKSSALLSESSPRMQFLIETITSLKNNKLKLESEASHQLSIRLKKFLGNFSSGSIVDPLQVSLEDIRSVEQKGKWWLVGSAWKGTGEVQQVQEASNSAITDVLDKAEPNWLELAKAQRMNTDIRRAIFISIMSANDYVEAITKLDKLALKKAQEREIPKILVHCTVVEPAWNPYYGILSAKLCESHSYRKSFQFMLWDLVKALNSNGDEDEDEVFFSNFSEDDNGEDTLKKILNLGRLFGYLFAQGSLALHILRTVNFISASSNLTLLMEVLLITFLDQIAKKSQVSSIGVGLSVKQHVSEQNFDDRKLIERILKAKDEPSLLKGMSYFVSNRLHASDFVTGKKQRKRIDWGVKAITDIIEELLQENESS